MTGGHGDDQGAEADRERRLNEAMAAYVGAADAGAPPDRGAVLAAHPDLAEELAAFFADHDRLDRLAGPFRAAALGARESEGTADAPTAEGGTARTEGREAGGPSLRETLPLDGAAGGNRVRYLGDYLLIDRIASGGMGVVYRAMQMAHRRGDAPDVPLRDVAVKMIRAGSLASDAEVERFYTEARAAAELDHPHIVPIYEVGEHQGEPYFSMKLVDGPGLDRRLPEYHADPRRAALLLAKVARAVHHAHQRGILHRDLKPANVLVDAAGEPHVTDFGLAKRVEGGDSLTLSGAVMGTPAYMAPEQARGAKGGLTTATDVYGLGAVLYELLTGAPPFRGSSVAETLGQVLGRDPERPRSVNPRAPRDLETVCLKCLEKDPRRRYDSAAAVADDLERWVNHEPILARRAGSWERLGKWARRHPAAAALAGMSGVAALTLVGLGVALAYHSDLKAAYADVEKQRGFAEKQRGRAEEALAGERRLLYYNRINFADREFRENSPAQTERHLADCPADQRGWEWHYLKRQCHTELLTIHAHKGWASSVAYSPDGRYLASTGVDKRVVLWDAKTGREVWEFEGPFATPNSLAFSPDGRRLAVIFGSNHQTGELHIREVPSGRARPVLPIGNGSHSSVAFSPDGGEIAVADGPHGSDGQIRIIAAEGGGERRVIRVTGMPLFNVRYSPDGTRLVGVVGKMNSSDPGTKPGEIWVWNVKTGEAVHRLRGHVSRVLGAVFSPDGGRIASAGTDGEVKIWDATEGREQRSDRNHRGCVNWAAFSPDGRYLATASDDGSARVWDPETGRDVLKLRGHRGPFYHLAFSPDGTRLVTSGNDGDVKVWDAVAPTEAVTLQGHPVFGNAVAFSPDGSRLVTGGTDRSAMIWDVKTGRHVASLQGHGETVWGVAFSPDGTRIATAAGDWKEQGRPGEIKVWDAAKGRTLHSLAAHKGIAWCVAFSPDGRTLASGGGEKNTPGQEVILWDVATGRPIRRIPNLGAGVMTAAFSPDGRTIAAAVGNAVRTWEVDTGKGRLTCQGHTSTISSLKFSPDGRRIVSGSDDTLLKVWDADKGTLIRTLSGHKYFVSTLTFSPDGRRVASGSLDRTLRIWDAETGQELIALRGHDASIRGVAFSPDGHKVASADVDGSIKIWDGTPE